MTNTSKIILTCTFFTAIVVGGIHYFRDPQEMLKSAAESNLILTDIITARQLKLDAKEKKEEEEAVPLAYKAWQQGKEDGRQAIPRFIDAIAKNLGQGRSFFPLQIPHYLDSPNQSYAQAFVQELRTGITDPRVHFSPELKFMTWKNRYTVDVQVY